jgi:3-phosphoshikimate 1-carboxyvinyltransferase
MVEALVKLGFEINVENDPNEFCNRRITVRGLGGKIPKAGTQEKPLELFVGNAGTAARFLAAFVCLGNGIYRLHGVPRMHERPQAALFQALRELGYRVESENDKLPTTIFGRADLLVGQDAQQRVPTTSSCTVSIEESSQFASALLLCAKHGGWGVKVVGENSEESPYVAMTLKIIEAFPDRGGRFQIEPDASSGSYFWAAGWLSPSPLERSIGLSKELEEDVLAFLTLNIGVPWLSAGDAATKRVEWQAEFSKTNDRRFAAALRWLDHLESHSEMGVRSWPSSKWQIDEAFPGFWPLPSKVSREMDLGDSIMSALVVSPFAARATQFTKLGRLRLQECERVAALRTELSKCGVEILEHDDTLTVFPSNLTIHGAEIETYKDHRMAMCFAILGLKVPGIKIKNPACVKKTFPNFFQKLAAPPPAGLGTTILDAKTGRKLEVDELFAS